MKAAVLRGDAARLPLPDGCVDLIITSPPFYKLRSYTDGGEHYQGQIGDEPTPAEFIATLINCTAEWARVLKPSGSMFVELGDTYSGAVTGARSGWAVPAKSRMLLPQRYATGCTDFLGLLMRAEIIWDHVNEIPESVQDRVRTSHSTVWHMVKQPKYYSAVDAIREPHTGGSHNAGPRAAVQSWQSGKGVTHRTGRTDKDQFNPLGRMPGSIWRIPSAPLVVPEWLGVEHYAAFPPELCRRAILGWSPPGICTACGQGRFPVPSKQLDVRHIGAASERPGDISGRARWAHPEGKVIGANEVTITGWACNCTPYTDYPERRARAVLDGGQTWPGRLPVREYHFDRWEPPPATPAVVLDPFGGSGTTALVASVHGRRGISSDMSADYGRLARWRITDPGERARALGVPKPPPVPREQMSLFDLELLLLSFCGAATPRYRPGGPVGGVRGVVDQVRCCAARAPQPAEPRRRSPPRRRARHPVVHRRASWRGGVAGRHRVPRVPVDHHQ